MLINIPIAFLVTFYQLNGIVVNRKRIKVDFEVKFVMLLLCYNLLKGNYVLFVIRTKEMSGKSFVFIHKTYAS